MAIEVITGPEVIAGSTRVKSGTAHKMILNMISTSSMVSMGKTYGNLMVDLQTNNVKLKKRTVNILCFLTDLSGDEARQLLKDNHWKLKSAILIALIGCTPEEAEMKLERHRGYLKKAKEDGAP
jgi:N-acetylmuramic acid 6-phosphate etherase